MILNVTTKKSNDAYMCVVTVVRRNGSTILLLHTFVVCSIARN